MSNLRRWVWWTVALVALATLAGLGAWRIRLALPGQLRRIEVALRNEAARYGIGVTWRDVRFHPFYLSLTFEDVSLRDQIARLPLAHAHTVDISLSPRLLLLGESPVSKVRVRNFSIRFGEADRPILDRIRAAPSTGGAMPDILLYDGIVSVGPFGKLQQARFRLPSARIRDVRFFGTRITFAADNAAIVAEYPVVGEGNWPFPSISADLFVKDRVVNLRRLRAEGPVASFRLAGKADLAKGVNDLKGSGQVDIARWIAAEAPGARAASRFVREGRGEFTASLKGPLSDPAGSAKISLKGGRFEGLDAADFELALAVANRQLRVGSLKGTLWQGTLAGSGNWDLARKKGAATASLSRAWLGRMPWPAALGGWRTAGQGDVAVTLSGDPASVSGSVSLSAPDGLERAVGGAVADRIRMPVGVSLSGRANPEARTVAVEAARLRLGDHELTAAGSVDWRGRTLSLAGGAASPYGRSADFGIKEAFSWRRLSGRWGMQGAFDAPSVNGEATVESVGVRTFPAVPLSVKVEGDLADLVHFVADVPADVAKATATGSVTGPLSPNPLQVNGSVAARDIDFSKASQWLASAAAPPAFDPSAAVRYLEKLTGRGAADLDFAYSGAETNLSGTLRSDEIGLRGVPVRAVSVQGDWRSLPAGGRWRAEAGGEVAGGAFRVTGSGEGGRGDFRGTVERVDVARALALLPGRRVEGVRGTAAASFSARVAPDGRFDVPAISLSVSELDAAGVAWGTVTGEGQLGAETGTFRLESATPSIRLDGGVSRGEGLPVSFRLAGTQVPTAFLASLSGKPPGPAEGSWDLSADGRFRGAALVDGGVPFAEALSELRFRLRGASPAVSDVAFGAVEVDGGKQGDALSGELRTKAPDGRLDFTLGLRPGYPFHAKGGFSFANRKPGSAEEPRNPFSIAGRVELAGSLDAIDKTSGTIQVDQLRFKSGALDLSGKDLSARLGADGVRWAGGTLVASGNPVTVSGKVSWKGEMDARVEGKLPAAMVRLVKPVDEIFKRLDGTITMSLRVSGKADDPNVVGTGHLEGGVFSFKGYDQLFEEMRADAIISREKIVFEHFDGRSGGGYLDGRGELPLAFDKGQRMFFSVDFLDMRYPYPDDFRPVLQGHAELLGPVENLLVTGDVEIQSARYTRTIRPQKLLLDFKKRLADVTARRQKDEFRVRLDVNVVSDGTIEIRNNLAKATVKGEFKVVGDTSRVIVLGSFDLLEGQIEFQGDVYDVKHLSLDFNDPRKINPRIDARAETKKNNYLVTVLVTGTLDKYEVDLVSDPPLGKNDIVSLLSLGVTSQTLAGQEGAVAGSIAPSLILAPYKARVEEGIRGLVGLDKLAVEAAFSSVTKSFEPRFIVGKTFGDRLTVSVSTLVGATSDSSANVEFKLLEHVFLQGSWQSATTQKTGDVGGDIKFKYRYRTFRDFLGGRD